MTHLAKNVLIELFLYNLLFQEVMYDNLIGNFEGYMSCRNLTRRSVAVVDASQHTMPDEGGHSLRTRHSIPQVCLNFVP